DLVPGATATPMRPTLPDGQPLPWASSQEEPSSVERYSQPSGLGETGWSKESGLRWHSAAKTSPGLSGLKLRSIPPVDSSLDSTLRQVLPASVVLKIPPIGLGG